MELAEEAAETVEEDSQETKINISRTNPSTSSGSNSSFKRRKTRTHNDEKYIDAVKEILNTKPEEKSSVFDAFSTSIALQLEELSKLDKAAAFSTMAQFQTLLNDKIQVALRSNSSSSSLSSKERLASTSSSSSVNIHLSKIDTPSTDSSPRTYSIVDSAIASAGIFEDDVYSD